MLDKLSGINGELEVYKDKLILRKSWFLTRIFNAGRIKGKEVYYEEIENFQYNKGTHFTNGSLIFKLKDNNEEISFKKVGNDKAMEIYNFLKENLDIEVEDIGGDISGAEEIRDYKRLFDDGIITKEEFERKKKNILNR